MGFMDGMIGNWVGMFRGWRDWRWVSWMAWVSGLAMAWVSGSAMAGLEHKINSGSAMPSLLSLD